MMCLDFRFQKMDIITLPLKEYALPDMILLTLPDQRIFYSRP